jgi:outer membrane protein OmpA-like peptidoglycan-associated protein
MNESSADSLSASFTDLMTSLAVIFILLLVAATNATVHRFQQEKGKTANDRDDLVKKVQEAFPNIDVKGDPRDPLGVIVILPQGLLNFEFDDDRIPDEGEQFLGEFVPKFAQIVCATPDTVRSVVVEGHTDEVGKDLHNVELSQRRATAVAKDTLTILTERDQRNYPCFLGMMSASGRGKNDLIYLNGKLDEAKSRRVEFHLRVPSFEQRNAAEPNPMAPIKRAAGDLSEVQFRHE